MKKKLLVVIVLLLSSSVICFSQNNWDGDNPIGNLTYCNNWYSDACPSTWNSTTDLLFNYRNNASQLTLYNDFGSWRDLRSIIFATTYGQSTPFNGAGNGFNLWFKVENNSSFSQTINVPLSAKGTGFELNAVNADLTISNIIYNDNNISGNIYNSNKSTVLSNYIVGNSTVKLYLKNTNYGYLKINCDMPALSSTSFQGGINVERGELWFNSGAKINGGTLTIGNGDANVCKLYINATTGGTTVNNSVNVPTSSTNSFIGGLNTSGTNTYAGTFTLNNVTTFENYGGGTLDIQGNITGSVGVNTGRISGSGNSIIKYSTNTKSYTGNTLIGANSTLQLSLANVLPSTNNFTVASGGTLQVSANQTLADLDLSGGGNLTVDAGVVLTITGTYTGGTGTISNLGTIVLQGGTLQTFPGASAVINNGTANTLTNLTINNSSGVTLNKSLTISGDLTLTTGALNVGSNTLTYSGSSLTRSSGSLNVGSATLVFTNTSAVSIPASTFLNINNLTINGSGGVTMNNSINVAGTLTLTTGTFTVGSGGTTLALNGAAIAGTPTNLATTSGSRISFGGTNAGPLSLPSSVTALSTLIINNTNATPATININSNLTVSFALTLTSGVLATGANTLTFSGANTALTRTSGTINASNSSALVVFSNTGAAYSLSNSLFTGNPNAITVNGSGVTLATVLTVTSALNLTSGVLDNTSFNVTLGNGATITRSAGTISAIPVFGTTVNVTYTNSSNVVTSFELPVGAGNATVLNNLTIATSGTSITLNLLVSAASIQINGVLALSGTSTGSFGVSSNTITFAGTSSITRTGNITINATNASANLTFTNTSAITIPAGAIGGSITRLVINGSGGVTLAGNQTIATALTLTSGTLTLGANTTLTYSNTAGGLTRSSGNIDASNSGATVAFTNTTSNVNLLSGLFTGNISNLTINGAGGVTMQSAITVSAALTLTSGKLAIGSNTLTLNGTVSSMNATNSLTTTTSSNISIGGTGALGTLFFDAASNNLNNLTINRSTSGSVTLGNALNVSGVVTPTNGQLTTGGFLTLVSTTITGGGAIGDASANTGNATNYISGNVNVQRYTQAQRGYRTLAHPYTTAQTVSQLTDNFQITGLTSGALGTYGVSTGAPSALYYDGTKPVGTTSVLGRITNSASTDWAVGKGLYVFIRGNGNEGNAGSYTAGTVNGVTQPGGISPLTLDVTNGTINQGNVIVTLTPYVNGQDNYTLVGNPYPCPINLSGVTGISSFGTVYLYNPTYSVGATTVLRGGFESTSSKNIVIPSMGCFYIQSTAGTPSTITFKESDKVAGGTSSYAVFGTGIATPKIGLEISTSAGFMDRTRIVFDDNAASTATDFYDGGKLGNNLVTFYSLSSERKALGIDYRKTNTADIIPLGIQTATATNYTISLSELTDLPNTQVVLKDKLLKTETILSQVGDSYSFAITADTATKGENRFEIGLLGTTVLPVQIADITAQLQTNKTVAVNWTSTTEVNLANYKVQRSKDGSNFTTVGTVAAKGASSYSYSDDLNNAGTLPATIYYRLEAVDKDGSKTYSKVVAVALGSSVAKTSINIYPNPVQSTLFAQVTVTKAGAAQLRVVDAQGKIVATQKTQLAVGTTSISIPAAQLSAGSYTLEIKTTDGKQQQRFVKE